jgi:hypothetical protein
MPNRTICDVLEAMRKAYETRNFSYLMGLIEEAQNKANRMEAALHDRDDLEYYQKDIRRLKREKAKLEKEVNALEEKKDEAESK